MATGAAGGAAFVLALAAGVAIGFSVAADLNAAVRNGSAPSLNEFRGLVIRGEVPANNRKTRAVAPAAFLAGDRFTGRA
jgi:hypothetical protein